MKYELIKIQFEDLYKIILRLSENYDENELTKSYNNDIFMDAFSEILGDYRKFEKLIEESAMNAREIFLVILTYTGCEVKQLTKMMNKDLKKAFKTQEII